MSTRKAQLELLECKGHEDGEGPRLALVVRYQGAILAEACMTLPECEALGVNLARVARCLRTAAHN